jgi:hypothetical protein
LIGGNENIDAFEAKQYIGLYQASGMVWFDGVQLEKAANPE